MIEIRKTTSAEVIAQTQLLADYAEECALPEIGPINPQGETYAAMERSGVNQFFAAFEGEKMIGFASLLMCILPHYGVKVATVESLYVSPSNRGGLAGRGLMRTVERYAEEMECKAILYSAPANGKLEKILGHKGYRKTNSVFCRPLTKQF